MRAEKNTLVDEVKKKIDGCPYVIITDYTGMNVPQFSELRNRLRAGGAKFSVVKNTILRVASKSLGLPDASELLAGQTAIVSGSKDVCAAAKVLKSYSAEFKKPVIRGAILDGALLNNEQVKALADLPSREALLAQILGLLNAPATKLVRMTSTPGEMLARVLQAKADKGE